MIGRIGVIDIGTLKVKCQIVEVQGNGEIKTLEQSNTLTILGRGLAATIKELKRCKKLFEKYKVTNSRIVSTHALREMGEKGKETANKIKREVGFDVEIISAQQEAELFFKAVLSDFETDEDFTVIDVGGGSVQILIGNKNELKHSFLFKTGTMSLWNKFNPNHKGCDAPSKENITKKREDITSKQKDIPEGLKTPLIYGSSCVIELFKGINVPFKSYTKSKSHPYYSEVADLEYFFEKMWPLSYDERERKYQSPTPRYMWGMDVAALNVLELAKKVGAPYIIPSNANINQGLIKSLI